MLHIHHTFPCYMSCTMIPLFLPLVTNLAPCNTQRDQRRVASAADCETEVKGDSKRTNEGVPSLVGSLGLSCQYKRFLFCLGCFSRPSTKYFFYLPIHYFNYFVSLAQQAGQAAVLGRLSLSVQSLITPSFALLHNPPTCYTFTSHVPPSFPKMHHS